MATIKLLTLLHAKMFIKIATPVSTWNPTIMYIKLTIMSTEEKTEKESQHKTTCSIISHTTNIHFLSKHNFGDNWNFNLLIIQ